MPVKPRAGLQILLFMLLVAAALFGSAGRIDLGWFWGYLAVLAGVCALSFATIDPDLMQERMRPGGQSVGLRFLPLVLLLYLHWIVAGLDVGRLHVSSTIPPALQAVALVLFALAWIGFIWAMKVNRFFSSIPRIQAERGHRVVSAGPYSVVRHPGYTAAASGALTSGVALGSWLACFIAPVALVLLLRRTIVEERMLQRDLPGYADYAARVRYRLVPGLW